MKRLLTGFLFVLASALLINTETAQAQIATPSVVNFPATVVGTTSSDVVLTASRPGGAATTVANVTNSNATDFTIVNDDCSGATIGGILGGTCEVTVRFNPTATGPLSATITIDTGAVDPAVTLNGTGLHNATVQFSQPIFSVNEAAATVNATLEVTRTGNLDGAGNVTVNLTDGTATGAAAIALGVDYVNTALTFTFVAGQASATQTVAINGVSDTDVEPTENFVATIASTTIPNAGIGFNSVADVNIHDDDSPPAPGVFDFNPNSYVVSEGAGSFDICITRSNGSDGSVDVDFAVLDGSATGSGTDYTLASGTETFVAADTVECQTVTVVDDAAVETNETFTVVLSNPTGGATLGSGSVVAVTIVDNDAATPTVAFDSASYSVGEAGANVTLTLVRSGDLSTDFDVDAVTYDGTAVDPTEYTGGTTTVNFAPGEVIKTVSIALAADDAVAEPVLSFFANLENLVNNSGLTGIGAPSFVPVNILDDDGPTTFSMGALTYFFGEGTVAQLVTVNRSGDASGTDTVDLTATDVTATGTGTDYDVTPTGTLTFNPGETSKNILVTLVDDPDVEGNETFTLDLSAPSAGTTVDPIFALSTVTIVDNDDSGAAVLQFAQPTYTFSEGGVSGIVTVLRSGNLNSTVSVDFTHTDLTATDGGTDYDVTDATLTFNPGEIAKSIQVDLSEDVLLEPTETFRLTLDETSLTAGAVLGANGNSDVSILDNDGQATIQFAQASYIVSEAAGTSSFLVTRSGDTSGTVSVDVVPVDVSAVNTGTDYTLVDPTTVTFAPGQTMQFATFTLVSDGTVEPTETFLLTFDETSITGNASLGATSISEVSILDADGSSAVIQFAQPSYAFSEGGISGVVTVTRSGNTTSTVSVGFTHANLTATDGGTDYDVTDATLAFNPGEITKTILVDLTDDADVESTETFRLTLDDTSLTGGAVLGANAVADVSIIDNEGQATIQFGQANYVVSEGIGTFTAVVTRSGDTSTAIDVDVIPVDVTAVNGGTDYDLTDPTPVHFDAGETTQTVSIDVIDDSTIEQTESFLLTFDATSLTSSAVLGAVSTSQVDIVDNDGNATVEFKQANYSFGEGLVQGIVFAIRSGDASQTVTVPLTVTDVTATGGAVDYDVATTDVTFGTGESVKTFLVDLTDDTDIEPTESFLLEFGAPSVGSAILGVNSIAEADILDNDGASTFDIEKSEYVIGEGGVNLAVLVTRSGSTAVSQDVDVDTSDVSATAGVDYTDISTTTLTFGVGVTTQTVLIPILEDTDVESNETFAVALSNPTDGALLGVPSTALATIVDNDGDATVEFNPADYSFSEGLGVVTIKVLRSGDSSSAVTVPFAVAPVSAATPADFSVTTISPLVFGIGVTSQTITVTLADDALIEPTESFLVTLSPPTSGSAVLGVDSSAQVDIVDNDGDASISFSKPTYAFNEDAGTVTVLVVRSGDSSDPVGVSFAASDVSATAADYAVTTVSPLAFAAFETTKTLTITLTDDTEVEPTETFDIALSAPTGGAILGLDSTAEVSIEDNDNAGVLAFSADAFAFNEDIGTASVTVTRTGGSDGAVSVDCSTISGTATAPADFTAVTADTLNWADGDSAPKSCDVAIDDDLLGESDESFTVTLGNPSGDAVLGSINVADVVIVDNDEPGLISFSDDSYTVEEGATTVTLTVLRQGGTTGMVTVDYETVAGTATPPTDFDSTTGTLTWGDGDGSTRVISIPINDTDAETLKSFTVVLSSLTGGAEFGEFSSARVDIGFGVPSVPNNTDGGGCSLAAGDRETSKAPLALAGLAVLGLLFFRSRDARRFLAAALRWSSVPALSFALMAAVGSTGCNKRPDVPAEAVEALHRLVSDAEGILTSVRDVDTCADLNQVADDLNTNQIVPCDTGRTQVSVLVTECNDDPFEGQGALVAVNENCVVAADGTTVDGTVTHSILTDGVNADTFSSAGVTVNGISYPVAGVTVTVPDGETATCEGVLTVLDLPCTVTTDCSTCEFLD